MKSMSPHARKVLDAARDSEALPRASRERLARELQWRIMRGEPALDLEIEPPHLPLARRPLLSSTSKGALHGAVSLLLASAALLVFPSHSRRGEPAAQPSRPPDRPTMVATVEPVSAEAPIPIDAPPPPPPKPPRAHAVAMARHRAMQAQAQLPSDGAAPSAEASVTPAAMRPESQAPALEPQSASKVEVGSALGSSEVEPVPHSGSRIDSSAPRADRVKPEERQALEEEIELLDAAHKALRDRNPERALAQLAEHAWRFPHGQLAESRDVARILALCQAGKTQLSRSEATLFLARRPHSPFAGRVRSICH